MVKTTSFHYPSSDGTHQIYATQWIPEGEPKAVVQIVHGICEYVERYDRFARFLAQRGYLVCGEDHLGHGRTGKAEGIFGWFSEEEGWNKILTDTHRLTEQMREEWPQLPCFLFGHSMGSFLTRHDLIRWPGEVTGAILSGTGQEAVPTIAAGRNLSGLLKKMGKGRKVSPLITKLSVGAYNQKFAPNRTSVDWLSRDPKVQDAYLADPLCTFAPTVGMFRDMMEGLTIIGNPANLTKMDKNTPVFFLSGDQDPVGQMGKGVEKVYGMFKEAGCKDVTLKLYREGRHEMLNELNYEQVQKDILNWIEAHLPAQKEGI